MLRKYNVFGHLDLPNVPFTYWEFLSTGRKHCEKEPRSFSHCGFFDHPNNTIFNNWREWDPLKIILSIWTPKFQVKLLNTRSYFRCVVSIKMRVC